MKRTKKTLLVALLLLIVCSVCFFAVSCQKKFTFTYNVDGGNAIAPVQNAEGTDVTLPIPTKDGYKFDGWYLNADFTGEKITEYKASADTTFYAKWAQLYAITVAENGGSLADKDNLALAANEDLYAYMSTRIPTKTGATFEGWYIGETKLAEGTLMSASAVTLTARYKVNYTVQIYKQNIDKTEYVKDAEDITSSDFEGATVVYDTAPEGFHEVESHANAVNSIQLSATAASNVLVKYYDRNDCEVTFWSNYPDESIDDERSVTVVYGVDFEAPSDYYSIEGYVLIGWSTSPIGEVMYKVDSINAINEDSSTTTANDRIAPTSSMSLYAVWVQGAVDMYDSYDYIYLLDENSEVIYASRGGVFFQGEYDPQTKTFAFWNKSGATIAFSGKLLSNESGLYVQQDASRQVDTYYRFYDGVGLDDSENFVFDAYDGITYYVANTDGQTSQSRGTYIYSADTGMYTATFTTGDKKDQTINFMVGTASSSGSTIRVFLVRNEDEYAMGPLVRFAINGTTLSYYTSAYMIVLDGMGHAAYFTSSSQYTTYYYVLTDDQLTLKNSSGQVVGVAYISEETIFGETVKGYKFYNEATDVTFEAEGGATLDLDGFFTATYTNGSTVATGYYTIASSLKGSQYSIITFTDIATNQPYTFLVRITSTTVGETTTTTYSFVVKPNGYSEFYYAATSASLYYVPMIVLDDDEAGKASVYGLLDAEGLTERVFVKIYTYSYTYDATTGLYAFSDQQAVVTTEDVVTMTHIDMSTLTGFVARNFTVQQNRFLMMYSTTTADGTTSYGDTYTDTNGYSLFLIKGFAVYTRGENLFIGTYTTNADTGLTTLSFTINNSAVALYVELDTAQNTFIELTHAPLNAYIVNSDGTYSRRVYLALDGKGGAVYTVLKVEDGSFVEDENGGYVIETAVAGIFTFTTRTTPLGDELCHFASSNEGAIESFDFLFMSMSNTSYAFVSYDEYKGVFSGTNIVLTLDGCSYRATYVDNRGNTYAGIYAITTEGEGESAKTYITLSTDYGTFYFDVVGDRQITVRGTEYNRIFITINNNSFTGQYLEFDGYGVLSIFEPQLDEDGNIVVDEDGVAVRNYITQSGSYTFNADRTQLTLTYTVGSDKYTLVGILGGYTIGSNTYNAFIVTCEDVVSTFLDESDYSVLILDNVGGAVKYDDKGKLEQGSYIIINSDFLFYQNQAGDGCMYKYDKATGKVVKQVYAATSYYTADLESLLFTRYGYAVFGGTTFYYYSLNESGEIIIYSNDPTNESANKYGYVAENIGTYENLTTYGGKMYYRGTGFDINFARKTAEGDADTSTQYPVTIGRDTEGNPVMKPLGQLTFRPSGSAEFAVSGIVNIDGQNFPCTVVRQIVDGTTETYVRLEANLGYFRFDINIDFKGENIGGVVNTTYEVISMRRIVSLQSEMYASNLYIYYMLSGSTSFPNTWGIVTMTYEYNAEGTVTSEKLDAQFGHSMNYVGRLNGFYDLDGNLFTLEGLDFDYDENTGLYSAQFTKTDGYTYKIYFSIASSRYLSNTTTYTLQAITRVQTLTVGTYTVTLERVVGSDVYEKGTLYTYTIKNGDNEIEVDLTITIGDDRYYVVRTIDDKGTPDDTTDDKITASVYYTLTFTEEAIEKTITIGSGDSAQTVTVNPVAPYTSVVVAAETMTVAYTADGKSYAEISPSKGVIFVSFDDGTTTPALLLVRESKYDEATSTYSITVYNVKTQATEYYTVKVVEGVATITVAAAPVEPEETEQA